MKVLNKAYLVILQTPRNRSPEFLNESLEEINELARSAGMNVIGHTFGKVPRPSPSHFIREGKLRELYLQTKKMKINRLIFNVDLSPAQARNIEKVVKVAPMDRTGLILDIFGKRAKSKSGKLQVELARLNYLLPRLGGLGGVMSRLGGGIGTRGPGEQELEWDRRKIRRRISRVKDELKKVKKQRELIYSRRRKRNLVTVALVGYTNAGKSTLLNALTGAETYVRDKLFATLDPKTRSQNINGRQDLLFVDTVGFIKDLPHTLVESFHATLEGVSEASALVHVLDASSPRAREFKKATEAVLREIGAAEIPTVLALNKADLMTSEATDEVGRQWPEGILISAKAGQGLNSLLARLSEWTPPESNPDWHEVATPEGEEES